ncbi:UNVERIFIED_CONTAM: Phosphoglycerate mutase-like protein AT74H [Sesamum latifolium]|uniref:Phosphoglycerate mutase-like protein AT74H n=1 Tax=Sesamum latifolium TaxID=2727402 RepID=A0AAW2XEG4_9LAMI
MTNAGNLSCKNSFSNNKQKQNYLPKRIILVRHGETEVNEDETVLEYVPNYKINLSKKGRHQAHKTGSKIREIVSETDECWKVFFYVSPSSRTRETMEEIIGGGGETFPKEKVVECEKNAG